MAVVLVASSNWFVERTLKITILPSIIGTQLNYNAPAPERWGTGGYQEGGMIMKMQLFLRCKDHYEFRPFILPGFYLYFSTMRFYNVIGQG